MNWSHPVVIIVYVIYLDTVPHNELLLKLWKHGITGDLALVMVQGLLNCMQAVYVCVYQTFEYLPVILSVPKGSLLGLILCQ